MRATTKLALASVALAGLAVSPAHSQPISWVSRPSAEALDAAYPQKARDAGVPGHAWVRCRVNRAGLLIGCAGMGESQPGYGFEAAAVQLVQQMVAAARTDGPPFLAITLPVHFGPPTPARPLRPTAFKSHDAKTDMTIGRFRGLAPIGPYWPELALRTGLAGRTAVDCAVGPKGELRDCAVVGELTTNPMFGAAARRMAETGWMYAGPAPSDQNTPGDGIWRFEVDFPSRSLDDVR